MTQNESVEILNSYQKLWTEHLALRAERDALRAQLDAMRAEIATQIRRHCTLDPVYEGGAYRHHRDDTIAAVAAWVENPPAWVVCND